MLVTPLGITTEVIVVLFLNPGSAFTNSLTEKPSSEGGIVTAPPIPWYRTILATLIPSLVKT
jgi:hypothetical protein